MKRVVERVNDLAHTPAITAIKDVELRYSTSNRKEIEEKREQDLDTARRF